MLTMDLVKEIAAGAAAAVSPKGLFKLEDVAMGSWIDFISRDRGVQVWRGGEQAVTVHSPLEKVFAVANGATCACMLGP